MELFDPGNSAKLKEMMDKARKVNAERDKVDRENAEPVPDHAAELRNAISSIVAGIEIANWDCVCEGLDILQRAELRSRAKPSNGKK